MREKEKMVGLFGLFIWVVRVVKFIYEFSAE